MCADAPDTSGMNAAAKANADIAKEALDWYKQAYQEQAPLREAAAAKAMEVSDAQLGSMRQNDAISKDYWDYQQNTFRPVERAIVDAAQTYDTEARREQKAGEAIADVQQQIDASMGQQTRQLTRMGVNPNAGKFAAMYNQMTMAGALGKVQAASKARESVEMLGYARKMDAANLGRNLASNQATSAGVALNAGNSAAATGQMPLTQAQNATSQAAQGFNTAIQGNNSAGNIYGQVAQMQGKDSGVMGALGTVAGGFLGGNGFAKMIDSDENIKKDIKPVSDEQALAAVEKTPVSEWAYKDGEGDGGAHIGPMAQHVRATMGEKAAPGGKQIDPITMNGINMAAIAALSRKVDKLAKSKGAKALEGWLHSSLGSATATSRLRTRSTTESARIDWTSSPTNCTRPGCRRSWQRRMSASVSVISGRRMWQP